ncbi:MAG: helix-turn-helix domain-containing protein [Deltaproteobacteria bacterium]|nr:helix-turn-helix domain-containing protein [Deltaproteobacteria bacterium]
MLGMGDSAKLLGISRCTLWRLIKAGRLEKVEIYHNAYRLRRSDLLDLVNERSVSVPLATPSSDLCPPSSDTPEVPHG